LVESADAAILLDCGFGSFESFVNHASEALLDAIFVSHAHADHVADLEIFMDAKKVWRDQPRLVASPETMGFIAPDPNALPEGTLVFVSEVTPLELPKIQAEFSRTTHKIPTLAASVSIGGRHVIYCADTGPTWVAPPYFAGADLAIVECTLEIRSDSSSLFHLDAREAGVMARELSAHQTLVTHIPPSESGETRLAIARENAPKEDFILATTGLQLNVD
jgi:ribonuclease BN (tRNA processing enzyme)